MDMVSSVGDNGWKPRRPQGTKQARSTKAKAWIGRGAILLNQRDALLGEGVDRVVAA
jgi:hypothetical protein